MAFVTGHINGIDEEGKGVCLARIIDGKDVFDARTDGRKVGTVDAAGNIYGLKGEWVGRLDPDGTLGDDAAFKQLLK